MQKYNQSIMDQTLSTISQTPKPSNNRPVTTQFLMRPSIKSPKLNSSLEMSRVEEDYQNLSNRITKLTTIDKILTKEMRSAYKHTLHLSNIQKHNNLRALEKRQRKHNLTQLIESKRESFNLSRSESRDKKLRAFQENLSLKKSRANMLKDMKTNWEKQKKNNKKMDREQKYEFAQITRAISRHNREMRNLSQASHRKFIKERYSLSIEEDRLNTDRLKEKIRKMEEKESHIVEKLSNTLYVRNEHLRNLSHLLNISKLPISQRIN